MTPRLLFVTGTDTGVGKTVVAAGLLRAAGRAGLRTAALKPVAAGCERLAGRLVSEDALLLMREASVVLDYDDVNPVALEPPIAPHLAAARTGRVLGVEALASHCRRIASRELDWVVVEGAGGWLVPLNDDETLADLCRALAADVVLVVGMRLGCLNHALLSAAQIAGAGLRLAGWVASCVGPEMPALEANLDSLERRIDAPCLGRVPHVTAGDPIEAAARALDLESLA